MGSILFDDVHAMIDAKGALKDGGGVFCAMIDDGVREAHWCGAALLIVDPHFHMGWEIMLC